MNTADDPLDELLGKKEFGDKADVLRHAVLTQTVPVLRRRRVVRRLGWTMAFAGCYVAGAASIGIWSLDRSTAPLVATNPASTDQSPLAKSQAPERTKSRFEALRDAGALALREQNDLETAIRFYAQALKAATPHELANSDTNDDWLLMSLKDAHTKESGNVDDNRKT